MKKSLSLKSFVFVLALGVTTSASGASSLSEAQRDFAAGNVAEAKAKFALILAGDPSNVVAKNYLKMIAAHEAKTGGGAAIAQVQQLIIPTINYNEATLSEALSHIRTVAERVSDGKVKPNFVVAPDVDAAKKVTLQLSEIPLGNALEYIGNLTGTKFTYEQYAITVRAAGPSGAAPQ